MAGARFATGDPAHVPIGAYARAALESLGWWPQLEPQLVATVDVRAALRLLEIGQVDFALCYASDVPGAQPTAAGQRRPWTKSSTRRFRCSGWC